eukprot:3632766-Pleurochrysis_carterae.AAC.1
MCGVRVWHGVAEGTLFVRSTLDANRCVHLMSVAHILSGECLWAYHNLVSHEQKAYPIADLIVSQSLTGALPSTAGWRSCTRTT